MAWCLVAPSHYLNQWWLIIRVDLWHSPEGNFRRKAHVHVFIDYASKIIAISPRCQWVNTLRPRQDGRLFPDDIFKCIFFNGSVLILIKISLRFVPKAPINNIPALVQIMAWRRLGDKPLFEPIMLSLLTHICVTRPQWVKGRMLCLMPLQFLLTHWGRVTHICIGKLTIIGPDNCLSPGRRQAIIWTNAGILLIEHLGTNFSEVLIKINTFSFKKMYLKMLSGKLVAILSRPQCANNVHPNIDY